MQLCIHPSIHPYIRLSIYVSVQLCIYMSIHLFIYHPTINPSIYLSRYVPVYPSMYLSSIRLSICFSSSIHHPSIQLSIYLATYVSFHPSIYISVYRSNYLSRYVAINPATYLLMYLSIYLSVYPSMYLLDHLIARQTYQDIYFSSILSRLWAEKTMPLTIRAPAVPAAAVFDGGGTGKLHPRKDHGAWSQLHTFSIELSRQCHLHRLIGECRTISWQTGTLVEI